MVIWRPGHPPQIKGFDAYASLYADAKKWWNEGWVDYLTPQLYWKVESQGQSYPVLMQWWHEQNLHKRHLWPGNYTSRVISEADSRWAPDEITLQIKHTRSHPGATGNVHFSMKALMNEKRGMATALKEGPYSTPVLVPASPWLSDKSPMLPSLRFSKTEDKRTVSFASSDDKAPWLWVVRTLTGDHWNIDIYPGHKNTYAYVADTNADDTSALPKQIAVSAVSRTGVEGPVATLDLNQ